MVFVEPTHVFLDEMIGNHNDGLAFELQSLPGVSKVTISVVTLFSLTSEIGAKLFGHILWENVVGNLPKGYIRNVPLPRVPREQSTRQSRVPPNRIPHYYENTYANPMYKGTCRIRERISPPWQPNAINT
jgi:hypothetical protein